MFSADGNIALTSFQSHVKKIKLMGILTEAVLVGLALSVATTWSDLIVTTSEYLLPDLSPPMSKLISALVVTAFAVFAAAVTIMYVFFQKRPPSVTDIVHPENDTRAQQQSTQPHSHLPISRSGL